MDALDFSAGEVRLGSWLGAQRVESVIVGVGCLPVLFRVYFCLSDIRRDRGVKPSEGIFCVLIPELRVFGVVRQPASCYILFNQLADEGSVTRCSEANLEGDLIGVQNVSC